MIPSFSTIFVNQRTLFFAALLLAVGSWWLRLTIDEEVEKRPLGKHAPDYWIENFSARAMNAEGQPQHMLKADRLQHFADDESAELTNPRISFLTPRSNAWQVQSATGWVSADGKLVLLKGKVIATRNISPEDGELPLSLTTKDMRVQPENEYAETDQPVQIISGNSWLQAEGLRLWLKKPIRILLPKKVKAHYEVSK